VYQLGFRLAKSLGHATLYCVNAWDRNYEPHIDLEVYARDHGQEHLLSEWSPRFRSWYEAGDKAKSQQSVSEFLIRMNAEATILRGHGHYLVDWFKIGEGANYPGVDQITGWYNRNLRIFANLQRITEANGDRLLLIIGAGHLLILRHCVIASPEYTLNGFTYSLAAPTIRKHAHGESANSGWMQLT
jgi:hypothetical protein